MSTLQNAGVRGYVFLGHICKNEAPDGLKLCFIREAIERI